jgi:hypothetical protein
LSASIRSAGLRARGAPAHILVAGAAALIAAVTMASVAPAPAAAPVRGDGAADSSAAFAGTDAVGAGASVDAAGAYPHGQLDLAVEPASLAAQVPEPLFAFVLALADGDSLGVWTGRDVAAFADRMGRTSKLPLDRLELIERRPARPDEREARDGIRVGRIWRVVFSEPIDDPIPYSILGYHPGDFAVSRELVLSEWPLGDLVLTAVEDERRERVDVTGLTVLRLDAGYVVMDIDGWLDRLLGELLDDAWMDGFAAARIRGRLIGIGISVGRTGRRIHGEFDFQDDTVLGHGSAPAKAVSRHARKWVRPPRGSSRRPWQDWDD